MNEMNYYPLLSMTIHHIHDYLLLSITIIVISGRPFLSSTRLDSSLRLGFCFCLDGPFELIASRGDIHEGSRRNQALGSAYLQDFMVIALQPDILWYVYIYIHIYIYTHIYIHTYISLYAYISLVRYHYDLSLLINYILRCRHVNRVHHVLYFTTSASVWEASHWASTCRRKTKRSYGLYPYDRFISQNFHH